MSAKRKPWDMHDAEDGGDEPWLVSYADMVTLLFGFFVILYSMSTLDEKKFEQMSEKVAAAFKSTEDAGKKDSGLTNEARQIRALQLLVAMLNLGESVDQAVKSIEKAAATKTDMEAIKSALEEKLKNDPNVTLGKSKPTELPSVELVLPEKILFQPGMAELSPEAQKKIQQLGHEFRKIDAIEKIEVIGHTDSSPPGKNAAYKTNFALSSARAGAVAQELLHSGIPPEMIAIRGMADLEPLVREETPGSPKTSPSISKNDPSINRRVHIILRKVGRNE